MKAVALTEYLPIDNPRSLLDTELPSPPAPTGHDLLVEVRAVSVNPVDTKVRAPKDKREDAPKVLGWDAAGVVKAVGPGVTAFKPGDEVYYAGDLTRPGSNSQQQLVDSRIVGRKPKSLSFAQASALPLVAITAWEAFFLHLGLAPDGSAQGKSLLIIGGAGGVGSIAIQLAKLAGLTVLATASRGETQAWVQQLGADHVINHREPLPPQLKAAGFPQVDYIANFNNTDAYWAVMAEVIRPLGKIVSIVENSAPLDLNLLKAKSVSFHWELMFTRSMFQTADLAEQGKLLDAVAELIDQGRLQRIDREHHTPINAANLRAVHARLESGKAIGKIVLEGWEG
ncbi:MAG: zinc-binding alcohol dehydrogenase family protein [Verrucomicrobiota bacterium JB022]|nr:zinc-binding alcohol dehydrogenase family protein [Verrucomicrobiota bacterium JB022]